MRSLIFGMVAVAAMTGSAFAQSSTYVRPNGFGGYTITQPSTGSITYVRPDGFWRLCRPNAGRRYNLVYSSPRFWAATGLKRLSRRGRYRG